MQQLAMRARGIVHVRKVFVLLAQADREDDSARAASVRFLAGMVRSHQDNAPADGPSSGGVSGAGAGALGGVSLSLEPSSR